MIDKLIEQNERIKSLENNEDSAIKIMGKYKQALLEIERLNNIINELEKWIKEVLLSNAYSMGYKEAYKDIYYKLQELKDSDKE